MCAKEFRDTRPSLNPGFYIRLRAARDDDIEPRADARVEERCALLVERPQGDQVRQRVGSGHEL
ncbi:MAG: hypothetical protein JWM79_4008, partial [Nocardioides sp.]|nr:hypothetical protein [Nocardioides sp.]